MKLSSLRTLAVAVMGDADITGIAADNRDIVPGDLFAGVPGERVHGARFAPDALSRGAVAVLTDEEGSRYVPTGVPTAIAVDVADVLGRAAALAYGEPADQLRSFAVTGTNGKTTTAYMLDHILRRAGSMTGLVGTVALQIGGDIVPARLTTPQPTDLQRFLRRLVDAGGTDLVMEVSSHALAQRRTDPVRFTVAGFTNLTQDHLDYHASLEEYFEAKAALFDAEKSDAAVIWTDDEYGARLHQRLLEAGRDPVWVGRSPRDGRGWLVEGESQFRLLGETTHSCRTGLPGGFNTANAALAAAMALEAGVTAEAIADITPVVPGRMEVISTSPRVVVDFAHNADALEKVIASLRSDTRGRLITLTGSAGDRDAGKRPVMGRVVAEGSDLFYLTDDDPHTEDPAKIRAEIRAGAEGRVEVREIGDRAEAIAHAILHARPEDTVLLAGRGHETVQDVNGELVELDDRVAAREALARRDAP